MNSWYDRSDIRYVVIHHTATRWDATAQEVLSWMINRYWSVVPTHYIVDSYWTVLNVTDVNEPAGWFSDKNWWLTLDEALTLNRQSIHIEVVGTRVDTESKADMPKAQEKALRELVDNLLIQYPNAELTAHSLVDRNKGSCWQALLRTLLSEPEKEPQWMEISLSRYYSVMPNQKRYYNNRSYEDDFKMNCSWDPLVTSNWHQLTDADKYKSVACPKEYPLWTRIYIEWVWEVTCNDRGSAIKTKNWEVRIDMRCGVWDDALDNRSKCPTWKRRWYIIK